MRHKKKVIVTGGAGFIGSNLVDELVDDYEVVVIDNLSTGKQENVNEKADLYQYDLQDYDVIKKLFRNTEYVFHCAALPRIQPSIKLPRKFFDNNVKATLNVLNASYKNNVRRVVYSASSSAYGDQKKLPYKEDMVPNQKNPYAVYKYMGEQLCRMYTKVYGLETMVLRYFNVYGERQSTEGAYATVIGIFLSQKARKEPLTIVGDGNQKRDFTYVKDIVNANILASKVSSDYYWEKIDKVGNVFNIGRGKNISISELAGAISGLHKRIPERIGEVQETLANNKKARKYLGWHPTMDVLDWIEKYMFKHRDIYLSI